jgi:hypothetical protein
LSSPKLVQSQQRTLKLATEKYFDPNKALAITSTISKSQKIFKRDESELKIAISTPIVVN